MFSSITLRSQRTYDELSLRNLPYTNWNALSPLPIPPILLQSIVIIIIFWRRSWQPTPVFVPGKFHRPRSLAGYSLWGPKKPDTAEHTQIHTQSHFHSNTYTYHVPVAFGVFFNTQDAAGRISKV